MHWIKIEAILALASSAIVPVCAYAPVPRNSLRGETPITDLGKLGKKLSKAAMVYYPGSTEFELASKRWSVLDAPTVNIVVVPATENDVVETVKFANAQDLPFLAFNTAHAAITTLGRMDHGIEIYMNLLSSVKVAKDGKTVKIGGGTQSKAVTDTLWAAGKQTVTGTCECVSYMGPALGGGHGWLQGHHGLIADQFVSMNIVLADGTLKTIDSKSDLWWAMKGAGHNFGIVTSITSKIYDIEHTDWAIETLIYSADKVEEVYQAANDNLLGKQPEGVINWSYWVNSPDMDPNNPIILFYIIQEGVTAVNSTITKPFHDIGPLVIQPVAGDYRDLANWTGIALASAPCQKNGLVNPRFPIYLESYDVAATKQAYDLFSSETNGDSPFSNSLFMLEGYSTQGVSSINAKSSAFAFRDAHLLLAPLITYSPDGPALDKRAADLGVELRQILHKATGKKEMGSYVNYAFGDETPKAWYGSEQWRQDRLKALKGKYDPKGKFSFFGPIA
ncbi:hypothetical protein BGZ61DRAFT_522812 [Ilyonectria robusta]|uniref:uncharacterized protein n=1 Tax=Ilyonectria robusta TaxID=1079257 RepID=UPI001E8D336C|nr:uncharacterized protein BGZ61DRAFT_522812 [Ilyonectria robusta]KAH8664915.1 hypothetical protein BGZ61DRAFT_522812 [Ilyonectria robusta]